MQIDSPIGYLVLTSNFAVPLEHSLDIRFGALESIQIPSKNAGIDCLGILGIGLVAHSAHG